MQPSSHISITPFLVVNNAAEAIEFYKKGLGATEKVRYELPDGKLSAELMIGSALFFIGDEEAEYNNLSPHSIGGSPVRIVLTVYDPDAMFNRALIAGATQVCPVTTEESWRIGKMIDPFGHTWEIGCPLE